MSSQNTSDIVADANLCAWCLASGNVTGRRNLAAAYVLSSWKSRIACLDLCFVSRKFLSRLKRRGIKTRFADSRRLIYVSCKKAK